MILDWKAIAAEIYDEIEAEIQGLQTPPKLGVILVGNNPASLKYIEQKERTAKKIWIDFELFQLEEFILEEQLVEKIKELNNDPSISGFLIQLPLPVHLSKQSILRSISPKKDVDGFHPVNHGKLLLWDTDWFTACTPTGILELFKHQDLDLSWKNIVVIGRSNIVWKPLTLMLINAWATVVSCNSKTKDITHFTRNTDIVISATWVAELIWKDDIWDNTIIIDVGCNYVDWKMLWDCKFKEIHANGNLITPVPWWVGPMTVAILMKNTLKAHYLNN